MEKEHSKILLIIISITFLVFALSIAFYCVIFLPGIERFKQDQITQQSRADRERVMEEQIKQGYYASC